MSQESIERHPLIQRDGTDHISVYLEEVVEVIQSSKNLLTPQKDTLIDRLTKLTSSTSPNFEMIDEIFRRLFGKSVDELDPFSRREINVVLHDLKPVLIRKKDLIRLPEEVIKKVEARDELIRENSSLIRKNRELEDRNKFLEKRVSELAEQLSLIQTESDSTKSEEDDEVDKLEEKVTAYQEFVNEIESALEDISCDLPDRSSAKEVVSDVLRQLLGIDIDSLGPLEQREIDWILDDFGLGPEHLVDTTEIETLIKELKRKLKKADEQTKTPNSS